MFYCIKINFIFFIAFIGISAECFSIDSCLKKDSITCLQTEIYLGAKSFFDNPSINFINGLSIIKNKVQDSKSFKKDIKAEEAILLTSKSVEEKQKALQSYLATQIYHFWQDVSVSWNPLQTARSLIDFVPPSNFKYNATTDVTEARGKQKKLKLLLPLLIGIKLKLAALGALAYMIIAVIAKKAILAGVISLLVSGFLAAKNLIETHRQQEDLTAYHSVNWEAAAAAAAAGAWPPTAEIYSDPLDHETASIAATKKHIVYADITSKSNENSNK